MATTEELLAQLENNPEMYASDESQELVIDTETRTINIPASETLFGVKGDKNIERKYFRCPRIVGDNVDLSTHLIYIAYVYTESNSGSIFPTIGIQPYHCDDVEVDGDDITFSWKLSDHVFQSAGFIAFKMYAKEKEDSPYTVFNTAPAIGTVLYTIGDGEESVVSEYPDIINQLLAEMESVQEIATPEAMQGYVNDYFAENPPSGVEVDTTLTQSGKAADAKATGDELAKRIVAPEEEGTEGQVLTKDADGNNVWKTGMAGLEDGSVTTEKLSQELANELDIERHEYTEVEVEIKRAAYNSFYDGTETPNGTSTSTVLFKTPQKIRIENNHTQDITVTASRFANSDDYESATYTPGTKDNNARRDGSFLNGTIPMGESVTFDTYEYGSSGAEYIQLRFQPGTWSNAWNNIKVYAIYDSWRPTYTLPEANGIYEEDIPVRYTFQGASHALNKQQLIAVMPYYPDFTYNIRGGDYETVVVNSLDVFYLVDDSIFEGYHTNAFNKYYDARYSYVPCIFPKNGKTIQYDTSVNAGQNAEYAWAYHKTPPETELIGPKWVAISKMYSISHAASEDLGQEYYNEQIQTLNDSGPQLRYVTKFNDKNAPRRLLSTYVKRVDKQSDGTYYTSILKQSDNPLAGKKWTLFGDSLTDAYGGHDLTGNYFASKIAREFGMILDNRAKGGGNINTGANGNYTSINGCACLDQLISDVEDGITDPPDYITVAYGTNGYTAQNGTVDDTSENKETTCGAVKYFIEKCTEKFPNAFLGFVLPPLGSWKAEDGQQFPNANKDVDTAREAIKSVLDLPEYGGIPYIDMSKKSGITLDMLPDKIHISTDQTNLKYYRALRGFLITAGV